MYCCSKKLSISEETRLAFKKFRKYNQAFLKRTPWWLQLSLRLWLQKGSIISRSTFKCKTAIQLKSRESIRVRLEHPWDDTKSSFLLREGRYHCNFYSGFGKQLPVAATNILKGSHLCIEILLRGDEEDPHSYFPVFREGPKRWHWHRELEINNCRPVSRIEQYYIALTIMRFTTTYVVELNQYQTLHNTSTCIGI